MKEKITLTNSANVENNVAAQTNSPEETTRVESQSPAAVPPAKKGMVKTAAQVAGLAAVGAAAGAVFMGMYVPQAATEVAEAEPEAGIDSQPLNLPIAKLASDKMSFSEFFAAARAEVGPGGYFHFQGGWYGTHYAEEWAQLTPEQQQAFIKAISGHPNYVPEPVSPEPNILEIIIHDVAPVYPWITDDMPLTDAHALARAEIGPGGLFVHEGKTYSTYTPEELAQMTPEQHNLFLTSVTNANIGADEVLDVNLPIGEDPVVINLADNFNVIEGEISDTESPTGEDDAVINLADNNIIEGEILDTESPTGEDAAVINLADNNIIEGEISDTEGVVSGTVVDEGLINLGDGLIVQGALLDTDADGNMLAENIDEQTGEVIGVHEQSGSIETEFGPDPLAYNETDIDGAPDFDPAADMNNLA